MNETVARKVSVLIPVYNVEAYLPQCLDSVVGQTYRNLEILIADDGATDGCGAICDAYAARDPRITVFHKQNEGLLMTRRFLFARATGDLILCVDSDDYLKPEAIETAVEYLTRTDADMTFFSYDSVDENNQFRLRKPSFTADGTVFENESLIELRKRLIVGTYVVQIWDKLFKRELLSAEDDKNPLFRTVEFGEDVVQLLPIFERVKRVVVCDQPLYHYRFRNSSITKTFQLKRQTDLIAFMEERKLYAIRYGLSQEFMLAEFYPYLYCYFIKTFYPIGECKQYSNEELIGHFRKMWKTELIQKMLEVTLPPQMTTVDKMIALLYKNERFSLLLAFLRLEKRVVAVRNALRSRKKH